MKTLLEVLAEVNALATVPENEFVAAHAAAVADLQALVNAEKPAADSAPAPVDAPVPAPDAPVTPDAQA